MREDQDYEQARERSLARLAGGFDLRWQPGGGRDEIHERRRPRLDPALSTPTS